VHCTIVDKHQQRLLHTAEITRFGALLDTKLFSGATMRAVKYRWRILTNSGYYMMYVALFLKHSVVKNPVLCRAMGLMPARALRQHPLVRSQLLKSFAPFLMCVSLFFSLSKDARGDGSTP
jgi:hypothetical protein